jgi:hypothetical protein
LSQAEPVGIEFFRSPVELHPLQLANQVAQSVVPTSELIALINEPRLLRPLGARSAHAASTSARSAARSSGRISGADVRIVWRGGEINEMTVMLPVNAISALPRHAEMEARVLELARVGVDDA